MAPKLRRSILWIGASVLGAGLLLAMIALVLTMRFGSLTIGLAYLRGQQLVVIPATLDLGSAPE